MNETTKDPQGEDEDGGCEDSSCSDDLCLPHDLASDSDESGSGFIDDGVDELSGSDSGSGMGGGDGSGSSSSRVRIEQLPSDDESEEAPQPTKTRCVAPMIHAPSFTIFFHPQGLH
jgi:hypothetical protein